MPKITASVSVATIEQLLLAHPLSADLVTFEVQ